MSKSLGNFVTINEVLKDWPGEVVRFNMLRTHYRQPIDWTVKGLQESLRILTVFYRAAGTRSAAVAELRRRPCSTPCAMTSIRRKPLRNCMRWTLLMNTPTLGRACARWASSAGLEDKRAGRHGQGRRS